jgi:hypothetical protein
MVPVFLTVVPGTHDKYDMAKILAVGCSLTRGHGLELEDQDPRLWVNQLCREVFGNVTIHNLSRSGYNNEWIFLEASTALIKNYYDVVLVGWSVIPRFNFHLGLELYQTKTKLLDGIAIDTNDQRFSSEWLEDTGNRLLRMHNDHWEILKIVKYVNILLELAAQQRQSRYRQTRIFFVNTLAPWCKDYFERQPVTHPSQLDPYIQQVLQADNRDDQEAIDLYNMTQDHYQNYGGIQPSNWLNLYQSFFSMKVDDASNADNHPGSASHDLFTNYLAPVLLSRLRNQ